LDLLSPSSSVTDIAVLSDITISENVKIPSGKTIHVVKGSDVPIR